MDWVFLYFIKILLHSGMTSWCTRGLCPKRWGQHFHKLWVLWKKRETWKVAITTLFWKHAIRKVWETTQWQRLVRAVLVRCSVPPPPPPPPGHATKPHSWNELGMIMLCKMRIICIYHCNNYQTMSCVKACDNRIADPYIAYYYQKRDMTCKTVMSMVINFITFHLCQCAATSFPYWDNVPTDLNNNY